MLHLNPVAALTLSLGLLVLPLAPELAAGERAELEETRRVITITGADGEPAVLADGPSANSVMLNGSRISRIWETTEMPVNLQVSGDAGATAGNAYREGFVGSSLYTADIPPGSGLDDIPMHAQDSLDYIAVLEGEIDLLLPGQDIRLRRGDVLVQAGNLHSWANRSDRPARLLVVVLTGSRGSAGIPDATGD